MNEFDLGQVIARIIVAENERALTAKEEEILRDWLASDARNRELYRRLKAGINIPSRVHALEKFDSHNAFLAFTQKAKRNKVLQLRKKMLHFAAVLVLAFSVAGILYWMKPAETEKVAQSEVVIEPGESKAVLQLADGTKVNLEDQAKEIPEAGTLISTDQKKVVYKNPKKKISPGEIKYNTINIPRGGEYQLTLSDGTNVWLNAETTIRYPVAFASNKREVFIRGEAYFEVTHNERQPFIVNTGKARIRVLGTSFNVRAYNDEAIERTTLVEGKVAVSAEMEAKEFTLLPNEQFSTTGAQSEVRKVNVGQYIAWKDGRIYYENNSLGEILSDLSRWYNISVRYSDTTLAELRFSIDMKRYDDFSKFLEIIELTKKAKFEINENEITVTGM